MNILITGNLGYVGPVVAIHLRKAYPDARLIGVDTGYFVHSEAEAGSQPSLVDEQHTLDVRDVPADLLDHVDAVVHLAAVSNDPIGERYKDATYAINYAASVDLAEKARSRGVRRFVFASSCSVYGYVGDGSAHENHPLNPLTAYAQSKALTEQALQPLAGAAFCVTCLRFATACGTSRNLRLDLVLHDFVANAVAKNEILILSDGSPVRPLVHVRDMARAIQWAIERDCARTGPYFVANVGRNDWNFRVRDLARYVSEVMPGVSVRFSPDAQPDKRSYHVSFERFQREAPASQPCEDIAETIEELHRQIRGLPLHEGGFRRSRYVRMVALEDLRSKGLLDNDLRWTAGRTRHH